MITFGVGLPQTEFKQDYSAKTGCWQ